ncbi:predicted protein [Chaetoceros tenuissimus]|uniref:Uncharacterized protein n=1 Tax=Chaetoceros tenuissimus TaxID=426638 RepID=A0AAD3CRY3_9STRA|nr:predicted protein [Chaetoceros tenuissimus]
MHGTPSQGTHCYKSSRSRGGGCHNQDKSSSGADPNTCVTIEGWESNTCVTIKGWEYKFFSKYVYRGTNQTVFYTTGPCMHSTSEHTASSTDSQGSEANLGAASPPALSESVPGHLPTTATGLNPSEPGGMYAGGFTAAALGYHAELMIEPDAGRDDMEKQMAE